tara:strand:- start:73 stop:894 length:822 start_codon:yes stop_codon:yes gene_type:complete
MYEKLAYHANCWGHLGGNAVGVTSITQLTYMTFCKLEDPLTDIAKAGYTGIEIFDGNLFEYKDRLSELKKMLSNSGLKLIASYSGGNLIFNDILNEEIDKIKKSIDISKELGAIHFVVGGGAKKSNGTNDDDYNKLADSLNKIDLLCEKSDLEGHYHPHLSTIVEGPDEVKKIFNLTSINFCPDTAHLYAAGGDPSKLILDLKDKVSYVHLKGFQNNPFSFTPLDEGELDNSKVIDTLKKINFKGWITNELDAWDDPFDGALRSFNYVQNHFR